MPSNDYMREYMKTRWQKRRASAILQLGGKCVNCGSVDDLEFDHKDSSEKKFYISRMSSCSEAKWQEELAKCQLLCHDCHMKKTRIPQDMGNRIRTTVCVCGAVFYSTKAYAGHTRWCKEYASLAKR